MNLRIEEQEGNKRGNEERILRSVQAFRNANPRGKKKVEDIPFPLKRKGATRSSNSLQFLR